MNIRYGLPCSIFILCLECPLRLKLCVTGGSLTDFYVILGAEFEKIGHQAKLTIVKGRA